MRITGSRSLWGESLDPVFADSEPKSDLLCCQQRIKGYRPLANLREIVQPVTMLVHATISRLN